MGEVGLLGVTVEEEYSGGIVIDSTLGRGAVISIVLPADGVLADVVDIGA